SLHKRREGGHFLIAALCQQRHWCTAAPARGPCSRVPVPCYIGDLQSLTGRSSCELPASCLWSSRCWLSPVLLRPSRATSPTSAGQIGRDMLIAFWTPTTRPTVA